MARSDLRRHIRICPASDVLRRPVSIVGTPLALGSWWALWLIPLLVLVLYFRIVNEECFYETFRSM
jgi:hypothetical protein